MQRPRRLSYANVMSTIGVMLALGGTSYAAIKLPSNSVGSPQIKASAVGASELASNAVTSSDVKDRSLLARDFALGQLPTGATGANGATGATGAGPQGPIGPAGRRGAISVERTDFTVPDTGTATGLQVACPAGTKIIGGGSSVDADELGRLSGGVAPVPRQRRQARGRRDVRCLARHVSQPGGWARGRYGERMGDLRADMSTFTIGGDLEVHRLGFGAMRITGKGSGARRPTTTRRSRCCGAPSSSGSTSSTPPTATARTSPSSSSPRRCIRIRTASSSRRRAGSSAPGPGKWSRNGARAPQGGLRGLAADLRVDRIDLYQLHAPDADVPYAESVGALKELQDEGKIRHIGVSNVSVAQLAEARSIVEVVTVQNRFNLTDRVDQDVLEVCERDGLGFFPWFPLEAGDLAKPGGVVGEIAAAHDATPGQVALAWLLAALAGRCCRSRAPARSRTSRRTSRPRRSSSPPTSSRRLDAAGVAALLGGPWRGSTATRPSARCRARAPARAPSAR